MGKRMYYILKIIYENEEIPANKILELLKEYGIYLNIKTVYDTIKEINHFYEEMFHEQLIIVRKKAGYSISNLFSDGQLQLLLDSITYHQDLKYTEKEELKKKLLSFSSLKQKERLIDNPIEEKDMSFSLFLNLNTILKAIEEKKTIRFEYLHYQFDKDHFIEIYSKKESYHISPYQIVLNNNHYYLVGCYKKRKNELSIYRIDRMRHVMISKQTFYEIREQYNMQETIHKMMNMFSYSENIDLTIQYHQSILREVISRFSLEIEAKQINQEWYQSTIYDVQLSEGLIGWILMLQDKIKVIRPYSFKEEMKTRINHIYKLYEKE